MTYYDERGRRVELSSNAQRGGEGSVHRITGDPSRVAKIYHAGRLAPDVHRKLRVMLDQPPDDPSRTTSQHRSIAWVDGLLFADPGARELRGFTMPAIDTGEFRQAHVYYDPSDRLRVAGGAFTWRHLCAAARNLASAVAAIHGAAHRVGDLRETNLLVSRTSLVTLIDCDSFQIRDPRTSDVYPTRVATGDYLPPELHGIDFRTQAPDRYHADLFALAVLVFRFLMLGVHPFQARGPAVADAATTEAKIRKGVFAFSGRHRGAEPPEYAPPYAVVPAALRRLFDRAFVGGHKDPAARPSAAEWASALGAEAAAARTCRANGNHLFARALRSCPWCRMSSDPFPPALAVGGQIAVDAGSDRAVSNGARIDQIRSYARLALSDGAISDPELAYLRRVGGEMGLRVAVIDKVVDEEARRALPPRRPSPVSNGAHVTQSAPIGWPSPRDAWRSRGDRRLRSAAKAFVSVVCVVGAASALVPVVAPVVGALVAVPVLALIGDVAIRPGWRARAALPLTFAAHVHRALGSAARLFVPLVLVGAAVTRVPGIPRDVVFRVLAVAAAVLLVSTVVFRLPHSNDPSAAAIRAGRDVCRRRLVGDSGRMRKPAYALLAVAVATAAASGAGYAFWWPLTAP